MFERFMTMPASVTFSLLAGRFAASGARLPIVIPLLAACLAIVGLIPMAAARRKLHIPGYIGIALLAFALSLVFGKIAGLTRVAASAAGPILSIFSFLLIAVAIGSILALLFYRDPQ
jgi:hypothetical protein